MNLISWGERRSYKKYGFDLAKRYVVEHDGKRYDSKAIAGVARGKQHPHLGTLHSSDFTGGVNSVGRKFAELGFKFVDTHDEGTITADFGDLLQDAMSRFQTEKETFFGRKPELWAAMNAVKERLQSYEAVRRRPHIHCEWSLGQGNWLKVPWVALFDDRVTRSAQAGTYVVLLISEDLSRFYATLNQGATEIEKLHGRAGARNVLRQKAIEFRTKLAGIPLGHVQLESKVDLRTNHPRSKLYEDGTIGFVLYDPIQSATDQDVERDLEALLSAYEVLIEGAGSLTDESETVSQGKAATVKTPTNLILYGPPGTGKTFQTAAEAVQLCDGVLPNGGRKGLMERYRALKSAGRIEFVTFHQSFGYEDFIEGLRPQTGADDDEDGATGGFNLKPEPGIFKRIANVAEQSGAAPGGADAFDLSGRKFFKMSLGRSADQSEVYQAAIEGGYIALGYGGEHDWSDPKYEKWQAIFDRWRDIEPDIQPNRGDVVQTYSLRGAMKPGDIVIVSDGNSKFRAIGEVTGPYQYVPSTDGFRHRRPVRWLKVFEKSLPVDVILDGKFSMMSIHSLNPTNIKVQALQNLIGGTGETDKVAGEPEPYVLIIDEINRANISKVFGELITLLEPDKRLGSENALTVTLPYSKEEFGVPANLHVIGTMNTADRSIALLDTALRRRFRFQELMPQPELLAQASAACGIDLAATLTKLNSRIEYLFDREHQIGHAYFLPCKSKADVDDVVRGKVIPLLSEYFYESWEKVWQVLGEPEASDDGSFLIRHKLTGPAGSGGETFGIDRWRYVVKTEFSTTAYDQLT